MVYRHKCNCGTVFYGGRGTVHCPHCQVAERQRKKAERKALQEQRAAQRQAERKADRERLTKAEEVLNAIADGRRDAIAAAGEVPKNVFDAILLNGDGDDFEPETGDFEPSTALPGTSSKIEILAERVRRGVPLWHDEDRRTFDGSEED